MSKVLAQCRKRVSRVVPVCGDRFNIRSMTIGEMSRVAAVEPAKKTPLVIGLCLLEMDGKQAVVKRDGETDDDFSSRVATAIQDLPSRTVSELVTAITKLSRPPTIETLIKNCERTTMHNLPLCFAVQHNRTPEVGWSFMSHTHSTSGRFSGQRGMSCRLEKNGRMLVTP